MFSFLGLDPVPLPYYDPATKSLDFDLLNTTIGALPAQSVIVLQTSANNPTGCDPTFDQWRTLANTFLAHGHFAFLDSAYIGFVSGDPETDCAGIRIFANARVPMLVAATYGKAFGLYGERVGILCVTSQSAGVTQRIERQMKLLARAETGAMPAFGATIVENVLGDKELKKVWKDDVKGIAQQLSSRRVRLRRKLEDLETPGHWGHVTRQSGMFS